MSEDFFNSPKENENSDAIDQMNQKFYGKFNYPWRPLLMHKFQESNFLFDQLSHEIGDWEYKRFRNRDVKILVAGCGTNQALITALKFPQAQVLGCDVSDKSLDICEKVKNEIGLENLNLKHVSLNSIQYESEFDYIICTGVIHHNAKPDLVLRNLSRALKQDGVMELMVYNYYHRIHTTAYQKAIRILGSQSEGIDTDQELEITQKLINTFSLEGEMKKFLNKQKDYPLEALADSLLQPVEYSYTVNTLNKMAQECELKMLSYSPNQFDQLSGKINWNLKFQEQSLDEVYARLSDIERWQVSNLLMNENAPMLWFHFQKTSSGFARKEEQILNQEFLELVFSANHSKVQMYSLGDNEKYQIHENYINVPAPPRPLDKMAGQVFDEVDGKRSLRQILKALGVSIHWADICELRVFLTSREHPYLIQKYI